MDLETIVSRDNPRIKEYCKLCTGKQVRRKLGKFVLEGSRLCREALDAGVPVEYAFASGDWAEADNGMIRILEERLIPTFQISDPLERKIAETSGPQGIYFTCSLIPPLAKEALVRKKRILCLYDIQNPGNLGTLIRSADAFGFEAVVLSCGCCDLFSPKVLRSAMGSVFHIPYYIAPDMLRFEQEMAARGMISAAAVIDHADLQAGYCNLPEIHLLYIGNEGNGLPEDFAQACRYRLTLPMKGKAESLNAAMAAGILMWEIMK